MSGLLKGLYKNVVYTFQGMVWKPRSIHEDVLNDNLSRYGLNLGYLNNEFDNNQVPLSVGRFPKILREYSELTFILLNEIDEFNRAYGKVPMSQKEKSKKLANHLSRRALERISDDPAAFTRVLDSSGF
jgi:hypothetical protein